MIKKILTTPVRALLMLVATFALIVTFGFLSVLFLKNCVLWTLWPNWGFACKNINHQTDFDRKAINWFEDEVADRLEDFIGKGVEIVSRWLHGE